MPLSVDAMSDLSAPDRSIDIATKNGATSARAMMMTERLFSLAAAQENMASPLFNGGNEITAASYIGIDR